MYQPAPGRCSDCNTAGRGEGAILRPPPLPRLTRLLSIGETCGKGHSKDRQKSSRNYFGHFFLPLGSKLWPPGAKNAQFSSFSRMANISSENLHYLGNYNR